MSGRAGARTAPRQTWTLERMAQDVGDLAASLRVIEGYATLGHSYGAFFVLQHAVVIRGRRLAALRFER